MCANDVVASNGIRLDARLQMYRVETDQQDNSLHESGVSEVYTERTSILAPRRDSDVIEHPRFVREQSWSSNSSMNGLLVLKSQTLPDHTQNYSPVPRSAPETPLSKRRGSLQLPSFKVLGISSIRSSVPPQTSALAQNQQSNDMSSQRPSPGSDSPVTPLTGVLAPLTPPPEDAASSRSCTEMYRVQMGTNVYSTSSSDETPRGSDQIQSSTRSGSQNVILPQSLRLTESSTITKPPWLSQAIQKIVNSLQSRSLYEIQMVSQTLPSQAKDGRSRPTFEEILQSLQAELDPSPYITITHAVPEARIMEEIPKTPPSTPISRHEINDYFGSNQTIFTHAAVVPIYHSHLQTEANLSVEGRHTHHIAAPHSIRVSILERYIPPTMPSEIEDFFDVSPRSYLADRLSELSSEDGSLLLVYPTQTGGRTFARQYIAPIIDPFLRRFVMLNSLTSHVASSMGHMAAVDKMIDFEQMEDRLGNLCRALTARPAVRGQLSAYNITHAEVSSVVLDRSTWLNWYVEQEQSRLRQNLVEYHQAGGRMPESEGNREVTVGMLTRDFIDGIKKSEEVAGEAGIEVGMFVITRSRL